MDENIDTVLRDLGLSRVASRLENLALPSIRMMSTATEEKHFPLGVSKLGGLPDLPPGIDWPTWKDIPLAFVAQINLAEVQMLDIRNMLPASGMLYFFYDADHVPVGYDPALRGGWRVLYYDGVLSRLQRVPVPISLLEKEPTWVPEGHHYAACRLMFAVEMTLPPDDSTYIKALHLSEQELKAYRNVLGSMRREDRKPLHRLLGYPDALQGDMQVESQLVSHGLYLGNGWPDDLAQAEQWRSGVQEWQLLLQLDTDPEAQMLWGIEGRCYFWIQSEALRARHFENMWFIMQWT